MATQTVPRSGVLSDRTVATLVGVLYIAGTVAGVMSRVVTDWTGPEGPDYVASAASMGNRLATGALLVLVMGVALAFIPILVYPILRRTSQRLALGYVVFRGALETLTYILATVSWLVLYQLAGDYSPDGADAAGLRAAGNVLAKLSDVSGTTTVTFVFLIGAVMFYGVLFRARLVPRWLSVWGLLAVVPYLAYGLLASFGSGSSSLEGILDAPLGLQEMVLAVWLIVSGFNLTATGAADQTSLPKPAHT